VLPPLGDPGGITAPSLRKKSYAQTAENVGFIYNSEYKIVFFS
jgi:hypothetical protein